MKVLTLLNEKGGVGKTTLSVHIAAGLAIRGARVALLDMDAQANATKSLGLVESPNVYQLLVREDEWADLLVKPNPSYWAGEMEVLGKLFVLTGNVETRLIPMAIGDVMTLRNRLDELEGHVDVVVIDTAPTPSMLHAMILHATDGVIYPTECEALSLDGIQKTIVHVGALNTQRNTKALGEVAMLGIQPTMYGRTSAHEHGLSLMADTFKNRLYPAIPRRTVWTEASYHNKTIFAYAPDSIASAEAWALIDRVEKGLRVYVK